MPATCKRKRDEYESLDDENELVLGRQVLPIAVLPFDFDGVPEDGAQYLFTVRCAGAATRITYTMDSDHLISQRRDANLLPHVTRVDNPYATHETSVDVVPTQSSDHSLRKPAMPSEEWRSVVEERFKNLRRVCPRSYISKFPSFTICQNMAQPTINVQVPLPPNTIPEMKNRAGWWEFIAGAPESEWNPPKKPKANKNRKFRRGMRGFADEGPQGELEGAETEAFLPTPHATPSPSDQSPEGEPRIQREPTPTMLRLIDEVRFLLTPRSMLVYN